MKVDVYFDEKLTGIPPEHLDGLLALVRTAWDPGVTKESYFAGRAELFKANPYAADNGYPIAVLTDGPTVAGHDAGIPCALWASGTEFPAYYQAGLFLLPEYRGKGLGLAMPEKMGEVLETKTGFFVVPQQTRTHQRLGWLIPGTLPEYVRILNPDRFFRKMDLGAHPRLPAVARRALSPDGWGGRVLARSLPSALIRAHSLALGGPRKTPGSGESASWVSAFDRRIDSLWERERVNIRCAQVRRSAYLNFHFPHDRGWRKLMIERNGRVVAWAILYEKVFEGDVPLSGLRVTSLIDFLYGSEEPLDFQALLDCTVAEAERGGSDVLIATTTKPGTKRLLFRNAFLPIPGTVHFTCHTRRPGIDLAESLDGWYLTRGDADAAGTLGP